MAVDWTTAPLDSLIEPGRGISYGIVQPGSAVPDGVPIVRAGDVHEGRIDVSRPLRVSRAIEAAYSRTRLAGGELLLTIVGTVGESAVVPDSLAGWNTARAVAVIPVRKEVGARWVQMALRAPGVRALIDSRLNTTVQATLNLGDVAQLPIVLAPVREREAIVHILGTLDDKIDLNRRVNQTLEAMVQALFQSWFVDFDPVHARAEGRVADLPARIADLFPDRLVDSELGAIPAGWTVSSVADIATCVKGTSYSSSDLQDGKTALVTLKSFARGGGYRPDGLKAYVGRYKPEQVLRSGDLVIACTDVTQAAEVIGRPAMVQTSDDFQTLVASLDVLVVRPNDGRTPRSFVYCALRTDRFSDHTYAHSTGTTVLHLAKDAVPSYRLVVPPEGVLKAFGDVADQMLKAIDSNESQCRSLAALRDTMLPKLLSGELRVRDAEAFPAKAVDVT